MRARALAAVDDLQGARRALTECNDERSWTTAGCAAAIWAASRVGAADDPGLLIAMESWLEGSTVDGFVVAEGSPIAVRSQLEGLAALALGELDRAATSLRAAIPVGDARAPLWGALARLELARVLVTESQIHPPDPSIAEDATSPGAPSQANPGVDEAFRALVAARSFFAAGGYRHLEAAVDAVTRPAACAVAAPGVGHLVIGSDWSVGFGAMPPCSLGDRAGLHALRHLLVHRDRAVPAAEVAAVLDDEPFDLSEHLDGLLLARPELTPDDVLLVADDRTRSRVTKALRRTIDAVGGVHAALGAHLASSIRTGSLCRYAGSADLVWTLSPQEPQEPQEPLVPDAHAAQRARRRNGS